MELKCLEPLLEHGDTISSSWVAGSMSSGDSEMLERDPKLLECQNADSDTADNDSRTPPGEQGGRGSMDVGLLVRLCGSALLGEGVAEQRSSFVGDRPRRLVKTSILLSRSTLTAANFSASLTLSRTPSSSHSSSLIFASLTSESSSNICSCDFNPASTPKRCSVSSLSLSAKCFSQSDTSSRSDRDSAVRARTFDERALPVLGDVTDSNLALAVESCASRCSIYFAASELADRGLGRFSFRLLTCFTKGALKGGGVFPFNDPSRNFTMLAGGIFGFVGEPLLLASLYQEFPTPSLGAVAVLSSKICPNPDRGETRRRRFELWISCSMFTGLGGMSSPYNIRLSGLIGEFSRFAGRLKDSDVC